MSDGNHEHRLVPDDRRVDLPPDWERAIAEGWLTRADVEKRLRRIAVRDVGQLGPMGYDENGFVISLVADAVRVEGIGLFKVYPNDHDPPHLHVRPFGKNYDIRLRLDTGEELDPRPKGVTSKQIKNMQTALAELHDELGAWWSKGERDVVVPRARGDARKQRGPSWG